MAAGRVAGKVVSISGAGNLVTDITAEQLRAAPRDERTAVRCDDHETNGIFAADHKEPAFTFLAVLNEANVLELTIVGDSARDMLGIRPGAEVKVEW